MKYIITYEAKSTINVGDPKDGDYVVCIPKSFNFQSETVDYISHLIGILSIGRTCGVAYNFSVREYNSMPDLVHNNIRLYIDYDGVYQKTPRLYLPYLDSSDAKNEIVLWSNNKKYLQKNLDLYLSSLKFNI